MAKTRKYSICEQRFALGDADGFTHLEGRLECGGKASFVSGRFDGGVSGCEWERLRLDIKTEGYCEYKITVFASNSGVKPSATDWERHGLCRAVENSQELLLYKIMGRYLWFRLDVLGKAVFGGGALYTLGGSFEDYLPQIYRDSRESFSHRYLSIFFTAYSELFENVRGFGKNLDVRNAPDDFLPFLARWMGLGNLCGLLSPSELRRILLNGRQLCRYRGTRRAVLLVSELLANQKPVLLERMRLHKNTAAPYAQTYGRLYGENSNIVLLIFFGALENEVCTRLQRLTDMFVPVGNISRLVVMEKSTVLDGYTYLDYNARFAYESGGTAFGVKADEGFRLL